MPELGEMLARLPQDSYLRVRIHMLRVQIELIATDAYARRSGVTTAQSQIGAKLLTLLPPSSDPNWVGHYRTLKLARYCYRRSSDVLHGRASMLGVREAVVDEWEMITEDLRRIHKQGR